MELLPFQKVCWVLGAAAVLVYLVIQACRLVSDLWPYLACLALQSLPSQHTRLSRVVQLYGC